ncbi:MAG TPA: glycosyltransferase N-terminal domain-containing protein [Caulobacteraceae bacterium]|jgi:3-deoxy-D-manno-octulosonic-acid transferase|nr:glycosyltransferase N-terminal domain-containing protein [Caulobacteraceae bacterium]
MSKPISLRLYGLATGMAEPLAPLLLSSRVRRGKEDAARLGERLGHAGLTRPNGALVWLHGASVGEGVSLLPLIARIGEARPDLTVLVTSGTRTSAELLRQRLPAGAIHQYAPIDAPGPVARFLDHWRPGLGLFAESELWPNLILGARRRGVRLALISARMTEASARGWSRRPDAARAMLGGFEAILAQDAASEARLASLGGRVTGRLNLKRLGAPPPAEQGQLAALKAAIGKRRIVLAASTHPGEEALIAAAAVTEAPDRPLLIIAPRHPERGEAVAAELAQAGFEVVRRAQILPPWGRGTARSGVEGDRRASEGAEMISDGLEDGRGGGKPPPPPIGGPPPPTEEDLSRADIYLADTLGEMGLFYRLADIVVMGGSFVSGVGGHNPLEAAALGVGVLTGPERFNHADPYAEMIEAGAALAVADASGLGRELAALLAAPDRMRDLGARARAYAAGQAGAFDDGWRAIAPLLPSS